MPCAPAYAARCALSATVLLLGAGLPREAAATWSVVGVDPETREAGVAVASCVVAPFGTTILPEVAAVAPGVGALAAQAQFSQSTRDAALVLLQMGTPPQDVIDMVNATDFGSTNRQYGVVTLDGMTATFTGANAADWAGSLEGVGVAVQGNILYGPEVVGDALAAFEADAPGCPFTLADRLMLALEAGGAQGGDNRCSMEQSALAATLKVGREGDVKGALTIDIRIPSQPQGGDNPVVLLREAYDQWRADNPPDDSGCTAGTGSSGGPGGTESSAGPSDSSSGGGGPDAGDGVEGTDGAPTSGADGSTGGATAGAADSGDGGCGCTQPTKKGGAGSLLLLTVLFGFWGGTTRAPGRRGTPCARRTRRRRETGRPRPR